MITTSTTIAADARALATRIPRDPFDHRRRAGYPIPTRIDGVTPVSPSDNPDRKCDLCQRAVPYGVEMAQHMCPDCWRAYRNER